MEFIDRLKATVATSTTVLTIAAGASAHVAGIVFLVLEHIHGN